MERWRLNISGLVQGVGFRPFLFNLARQNDLSGWVRNNFAGVEVEIQGEKEQLVSFMTSIKVQAPSAAQIDEVRSIEIPSVPENEFVILTSEFGVLRGSPLPDQGICSDCWEEFFNPANRRYQHPFNSCTICGPRFTIIQDLPFDRQRTSMAEFELCPECQQEYRNPGDRRFHAQTTACSNCGPKLWFSDKDGKPITGDPVWKAKQIIKSGGILGIKGIGGYHLACLATSEESVSKLRKLKGRDNRAFAVMFRNMDVVKEYCFVTPPEETLLTSAVRPIVLLTQKKPGKLAQAVNPYLKEIGVFLPYTAIQMLLFNDEITALVMTSGNRSEEPLCVDDQAAVQILGGMVDGFLMHNRRIVWRCDDSVIRFQQNRVIGIRRSRGYAPAPVKVNREFIPLLACGAQQKNVFALTKGNNIYLSPHQGDLDNLATFLQYQATIAGLQRLLKCEPEWAIHDLHPDYHSTIYAQQSGLQTLGIQHHIAHLGSVIAACKIVGPLIGVAFDGSGYGTDGTIWGGEFFYGQTNSWRRMGFIAPLPLPGGEAAVKEPWRMTASYLSNHPGLAQWLERKKLTQSWHALEAAVKLGINAPLTSSAGRLFDGVAALIGGPLKVTYEGEAAIWLENHAILSAEGSYSIQIKSSNQGFQFDPVAVFDQIIEEIGIQEPGYISMKFHRTMALMIGEMVRKMADQTQCNQVALSGGVFQNRLLLDLTADILINQGLRVYIPDVIPMNDGGIALGQAYLGSYMIEEGIHDVFSHSR